MTCTKLSTHKRFTPKQISLDRTLQRVRVNRSVSASMAIDQSIVHLFGPFHPPIHLSVSPSVHRSISLNQSQSVRFVLLKLLDGMTTVLRDVVFIYRFEIIYLERKIEAEEKYSVTVQSHSPFTRGGRVW